MRELVILDSTLREGEQFTGAYFTQEQRLNIVRMLDVLGVPAIEVPSPIASPETRQAIEEICHIGLKSHVL